jgi:UPF0042 nucleotide-binding protein
MAHADAPCPQPLLRKLVLVTGLSGAGLTTVLKTLEDQGYEVVDNLPLRLLDPLLEEHDLLTRPLAISIDVRSRGFSAASLLAERDRLRALPDLSVELVYLTADLDVLQRRYSETRRQHPLAVGRPLLDGLKAEAALLDMLRDAADHVFDSSSSVVPDTRRWVRAAFDPAHRVMLALTVLSFSYRHGVPRDADLVFDVRFLRNPHYVETLQPHTGQHPDVAAFVFADPDAAAFQAGIRSLIEPALPRYREEGKSYLTVAFGCTGGKHRSVAMAEAFYQWLTQRGFPAAIRHRELPDP